MEGEELLEEEYADEIAVAYAAEGSDHQGCGGCLVSAIAATLFLILALALVLTL